MISAAVASAVSADRTVRALRRTVATDQDGAAVEPGLFRRLDSFGLRDVRRILFQK